MTDMITYCDVNTCEECPRYGDDCDGTDERLYTHEEAWGMCDRISRADAIRAVAEHFSFDDGCSNIYKDIDYYKGIAEHILKNVPSALPSAEAVSREEYEDIIKDYRKQYENMNNEIADLEAKLSDDAVEEWIPCNKQMPDELETVNVTWVNHLAPPYYKHIEGVPFVDSAVYYRGKWYWWNATVIDVLAEYGEVCNAEQIDKDIEILAWMPLPKPYKGGDTE